MHAKMCCCWAFADNRMWSWCVRLIFCTKYATLYISLRCQFDMMGIYHLRWNQDKIPVCRTRVIRGGTKDWTTTTSCDKKLNKLSYLVADMSVPNRKYSKNRLLLLRPQLPGTQGTSTVPGTVGSGWWEPVLALFTPGMWSTTLFTYSIDM